MAMLDSKATFQNIVFYLPGECLCLVTNVTVTVMIKIIDK